MPTTARTASPYPPLNVQAHTPRLSLLGATDELLERLVPVVRKGWPPGRRGRSTIRCRCTRTARSGNGAGSAGSGPAARR
ncbi:hypothetical protein ACFQXA_01460 [Nocardiopsis composta]